jgi:hypothetical protein
MAARKKPSTADLAPQSDPRAPLDAPRLLSQAQALLSELEADLLDRARSSPAVREALRVRHDAERAARRTADPLTLWERHFVTQVAASWVLSCVFVRTLEDRGLLGHARIAGPGAADSQRLFFETAPSLTEREYLLTVFRELSRLPAARDLFDARHNPVWLLGPSAGMTKKLLALFRAPSADAPGLRFGQADTRFLGDLYQDLSADVRERFALLQTPPFVESYILDRTLERAITRFGLDDTTLIDPTCGSGHFLLGAFERIVDHRLRKEPGMGAREAARIALGQVYGADINPYAVAIARFRLTLAFLDKAGYRRIADAPEVPVHVVVADSLLQAPQQSNLGDVSGTSKKAWAGSEFALEDEEAAKAVLFRRYAAVVGNPPYITVKDAVLRERYRELYPRSAAGKYSVAAPFTERFFLLAQPGGCVGMITANSFMKREFGKKLIEGFLPTVNLDGVVNTSGAYIPGHGTPTVLLFGTNETKQGNDVLTVLAKRGEPSTPDPPEAGLVWTSIVEHGGEVGFENDFISVARVQRGTLEKPPGRRGGGGAAELKELLEERAECRLVELTSHVGIAAVTGEDDLYLLPRHAAERMRIERSRPMVVGEELRDWGTAESAVVMFPYDDALAVVPIQQFPQMHRLLWTARSVISKRRRFGTPMLEKGLTWYELQELYAEKLRTPLSIIFAFVATHNHFVLDRGGKVFKQSAPIIKLKEGATEEDHLALLAYLNSSTACFWMKQVFFDKGSGTDTGKWQSERAKIAYEFAGTGLLKLPVPPLTTGRRTRLVALASEISRLSAARDDVVSGLVAGTFGSVAEARHRDATLLRKAVALQEEVDWLVYCAFGLVDEEKVGAATPPGSEVELGWRPFEVAAARRGGAAGLDGQRLNTADVTCPSIEVGRARVEALADEAIATVEVPEYKRRWLSTPKHLAGRVETLDDRLHPAARSAALEIVESALKDGPPGACVSVRDVDRRYNAVAAANRITEFVAEAGLTLSLTAHHLLEAESVPFLAAYRHTETGLEKRAVWERVWDLQRAEDRDEAVPPFDAPPKYDPKDYRVARYDDLRGKLDVPKERFISYPGCESDEDKEPIYGWAGWDHLQRAQALAAVYQKRRTEESWAKERLTPMLAGLLELVPWVKQWHNEPSAEFGGLRLGDYFEGFVEGECHTLGLTREDLRAWRPEAKGRGRGRAAKAEAVVAEEGEAGSAAEGDASAVVAANVAKKRGRKQKETPG